VATFLNDHENAPITPEISRRIRTTHPFHLLSGTKVCSNRQVIERYGGASRARTDGLVVANDALSQLSYSPVPGGFLISPTILTAFPHRHQRCLTNAPVLRLT
jgi:hypothetical protein